MEKCVGEILWLRWKVVQHNKHNKNNIILWLGWKVLQQNKQKRFELYQDVQSENIPSGGENNQIKRANRRISICTPDSIVLTCPKQSSLMM